MKRPIFINPRRGLLITNHTSIQPNQKAHPPENNTDIMNHSHHPSWQFTENLSKRLVVLQYRASYPPINGINNLQRIEREDVAYDK